MTVEIDPTLTIPSAREESVLADNALRETLGQLMKYILVGLLNTGVDAAIYLMLSRLPIWDLPLIAAKAVSYTAGMLCSFTLNRRWTFKSKSNRWLEAGLFLLSNLTALGINTGAMYLALSWFSLPDLAALVVATGVSFSWNFLLYKWLVFRRNIPKEVHPPYPTAV